MTLFLRTTTKSALLALSLAFVGAASVSPAAFASGDWSIKKTEWSATDERNFGAFITAIGESGCRNVDSCLKSSANPYRSTDSSSARFASDCGRFPFLLRTYFAWKNGLPMSVVSSVKAVDGLGSDLRYSPKGNYATSRRDLIQNSENRPLKGMVAIDAVMRTVGTPAYRVNAERDQPHGLFFDFVPAGINRTDVRPGTVIYDANGHAAIVYRVETDGRVRFIDAHPDNSVTRSVYGEKFARSSPNSGGGFKNFRPLKLSGATRLSNGNYIGGRITAVPMTQLASFSMEQYYGNQPSPDRHWTKARFVKNGQALGFYDWIRSSLAIGDLKYHPVEEMLNGMETLCSDLKDRVAAVDDAILHRINEKSQPYTLPDNIFGTAGEWESYSTPSRDARLKTSFRELRTEVQRYIELYRQGSPRIVYQGTDLVGDLRKSYEAAANACVIQYTRSDRSSVLLTYNHVALRLWNLSFDPYQCPELRWGATDPAEAMTCRDGGTKQAWYEAEQGLRNQIDRTYDVKMGFSLDQLRAKVPGSGVTSPPDIDLRGYLYSL